MAFTPFSTPGAQASTSAAPNSLPESKEKPSLDGMHVITQHPSQTSLASATVIESGSTVARNDSNNNEKNIPHPPSAYNNDNSNNGLDPFDTDMEAMITHTDSNNANIVNTATGKSSKHKAGSKSLGNACGESQVWPGQSHWKKKAKEQKIQRSRTCLSRLSKRNRLIAKILLGLFVLSIAVGVGLGISKPLGAAIWGQKN